jgi:hypothetical protein
MKLFKYIILYICVVNNALFSMNDGYWGLEKNLPPQINLEGRFVGFKKQRNKGSKKEDKFVRVDTTTFYSKRTPGEKRTRKFWNNNKYSNDEIKKRLDILLTRLPHKKLDKENKTRGESSILIDLTEDDNDFEASDVQLQKNSAGSAETPLFIDDQVCTDQSKIKKKTKISIRKVKRRKIAHGSADKHDKELFPEKIDQQRHKAEAEKERLLKKDVKEGKEKTFFAKAR